MLRLYCPQLEIMELSHPDMYSFLLTSLGKSHYFITDTKEKRDKWYNSLKSGTLVTLRNLNDNYEFGEIVGTGNFAEVRIGISKLTNETFAIKSISKERLQENISNFVMKTLFMQ